jgi:hypothetical protein
MKAPRLGARIGATNLYIKNDAVCLPTLSFKDRVVAVALANAQAFGFDTVGCSSTGNLANAVAAQAARLGLKTFILVPADLEPAKILNTQVYGATLVRVDGNYDHVNRLCSQIADRYNWGFVNVNLRPYYAEGSKTVGFEIAEQLGWRLPDNVVVPHGRRFADHQDPQGLQRAVASAWSKTSRSASSARRPPAARPSPPPSRTAPTSSSRSAQHHRPLAGHRQPRRRPYARAPFAPPAAGPRMSPTSRSSPAFRNSPRPKASSPRPPAASPPRSPRASTRTAASSPMNSPSPASPATASRPPTACRRYEQNQAIRPRLSDFETLWKNAPL